MTRCYDDPVDVRRQDEAPEQFLWRGRLYVVRGVLAHWVEAGAWWRSASVRAVVGGDDSGDGDAVADGGGAVGGGGGDAVGDRGAIAPSTSREVDDGEREMWRVEASAGRAQGSGVYDLCFDWSAGAWTLARTQD